MSAPALPGAGDGWIELDPEEQDSAGSGARSGVLSPEARRAAVAAALPLVGRYFATGRQPLAPQPALGHGPRDPSGAGTHDDEGRPDALLRALRLRAGLAAARRMSRILERIAGRETFRYELRPEECTGQLTGQLDVSRYLMRLGAVLDVPSYPVLAVRRTEQTPENVLAAYAARWLLRELRGCMAAVPVAPSGPEQRRYHEARQSLEGALRLPWLRVCVPAADRIRSGRAERDLLRSVKRRLRRGEVAAPVPYAELAGWVEEVLAGGPVVDPGDLEWDFYGERFDTRLFELWCLRELAAAISEQLVVPVPELDPGWREGRPAYAWSRYAGTIELYFQRSLPRVSGSRRARWVREDGTPLGGVPDLVVRAVGGTGEAARERFAVIDPKLRQRGGPPAEELYKLVGYMDNFGLSERPLGAILFHAETEPLTGYTYRDRGSGAAADGALHALRLDPARPDESREALAPLTSGVLGMLDIPRLDRDLDDAADDEERHYRAKQAELRAYADTIPPGVFRQWLNRLRVTLGDARWEALGEQAQTMLGTAEYIGFSLLDGSDAAPAAGGTSPVVGVDYSGPVIGVCAGIESVLHDWVITPATAHDARLRRECGRATLGKAIALVAESLRNLDNPQPRHEAVRAHIARAGIRADALGALVAPLRHISQSFRNPAAHREVLTRETWNRLWQIAVSEERVLPRVIDVVTGGAEGSAPGPSQA